MLSHRPSVDEPTRKIGNEHKVFSLYNNGGDRKSFEQAMISKSVKSLVPMKTTGRATKQQQGATTDTKQDKQDMNKFL